MKIFHTADWHLGKILQGVHLTEEQSIVLDTFIQDIKNEKPDCVIIAGDIYDRAVPPTEAVRLLNRVLENIVLQLNIPVIAIAGNHDSPTRLQFGSELLQSKGLYLVGEYEKTNKPIVLSDEYGEVHFHLIPYMEPSTVRHLFQNENITNHDEAMKHIIKQIEHTMDKNARHVLIGHAFVTPYGEEIANTSDSEKPLSIGGSEYVKADHFEVFDYVALGHLHQAHYVKKEHIRYAGSLYKYSISEEHHQKGYYVIDLLDKGNITIDKKPFYFRRDVRSIEATMEEILNMDISEDYVFVTLTDEFPVLSPMEKIRTIFPNAMHVNRKMVDQSLLKPHEKNKPKRTELSDEQLFTSFYKEVTGSEANKETKSLFSDVLQLYIENERHH